jgi:formate hydrogenlyase subunit 4
MQIAIILILAIAIPIAGIILGLFFKGIDRKGAAFYQGRIGPPIRQPYYDLKKLMVKQTIIPENAVPWIFKGAPLMAVVSAAVLLIYIWVPYFLSLFHIKDSFIYGGDIILIIYLLMLPAIFLIAGGFASGSPYATVGAQREMVILMTTELPLGVIAIAFASRMNTIAPHLPSFSLITISHNPLWQTLGPLGIMGGLLLVLTTIIILPAEVAAIPFDQGEAETEIAEGLIAEYSGKFLAFFQLADMLKVMALTSLVIILFFPHGIEMLVGSKVIIGSFDITIILDVILFLTKHLFVYFITVTTVRVTMARLKISQVARLFIITLTVISLTGFLLIYLDPIISKL